MKTGQNLTRLWMVCAAFAVALLMLIGLQAALASQAPPVQSKLDLAADGGGPFYWSDWLTITPGDCLTPTHGLGGDPDDYAVEILFLDTDDDLGLNRRHLGGAEDNGNWYGVHWQNLTSNTIQICRGAQDYVADQVRITVWKPPVSPDFDSTWVPITAGLPITFAHGLGITNTDLTVSL